MKKLIYFFLCTTLISSITSCTIQKRHYSKGYYLRWNQAAKSIGRVNPLVQECPTTLAIEVPVTSDIDSLQGISNYSEVNRSHQSDVKFLKKPTLIKPKVILELDTLTPIGELTPSYTLEEQRQLDLDRRRMKNSIFAMLGSIVLFLVSVAVLVQVDLIFFYVLLYLGVFGFYLFGVLALVYLGRRGAHKLEYSERRAYLEKKKENPERVEEERKTNQINALKEAELALKKSVKIGLIFLGCLILSILLGSAGAPIGYTILFGLVGFYGGATYLGIFIHRLIVRNKLRNEMLYE